MDEDRVHVELVVRRRYRSMAPFVEKAYMVFRELVRVAAVVAIGYVLISGTRIGAGLAVALTAGALWLLVDRWFGSDALGVSRVLLTDGGIYMMDDGLHCPWEDVVFHATHGDVITFEAAREVVTGGLLKSRRRRIPLGTRSRPEILQLFRERAGRRD